MSAQKVVAMGAIALLAGGCRAAPKAPAATLVVAYPAVPNTLLSYRTSDEFSASVLRNAYEPLIDLDRELSPEPCLAESWYSPDELTWAFRIRPGVHFHDGKVLTSEAAAAFLREANADPRSRRSIRVEMRSVEAQDAQTLVIQTRRPSGLLHGYFNSTLITSAPEQPGQPLLGTGPYRVRDFKPGERIVLEAFDGHRGGRPAIPRLEFVAVADGLERAKLVRDGRAHLAIDVPTEELASLRARTGVTVATRKGLRVIHLGMNVLPGGGAGAAPLRKVEVRRAIAHAVSREALVRGPLGGQGDVAHELVPPEVFGHHGGLEMPAFDPAEAKRLLAAAGYKGGFKTTLDYVTGRYRSIDAVAAAVAADLRAIGIEVELRALDLSAFRKHVSTERDTALFLMSWLSATGDAGTTFSVTVHTPDAEGHGIYSTYASPEVDQLITDSYGPVSLSRRRQLLGAVAERVHADMAVIPLYRQWDLYAFASNLDFHPRLDRRIRGFDMKWRDASP